MLKTYKNITNSIVNTVNRTIRSPNKTVEALVSRVEQKDFLQKVSFAVQRNILLGSISEASVKIKKDYFLSHSGNKPLFALCEEELNVYSIQSGFALKKGESLRHIRWHQLIYQNTPANCILFCHPLSVFQVFNNSPVQNSSEKFLLSHFPHAIKICIEDEVPKLLANFQFLVVQNSGLIAWGDTLPQLIADVDQLNWLCALIPKGL